MDTLGWIFDLHNDSVFIIFRRAVRNYFILVYMQFVETGLEDCSMISLTSPPLVMYDYLVHAFTSYTGDVMF